MAYLWNQPDTEQYFDTPDDALEYIVAGDRLRDIITDRRSLACFLINQAKYSEAQPKTNHTKSSRKLSPRELLLFSLFRFFPLQNGLAQRAVFIGKAQNSCFFEPRQGGI